MLVYEVILGRCVLLGQDKSTNFHKCVSVELIGHGKEWDDG